MLSGEGGQDCREFYTRREFLFLTYGYYEAAQGHQTDYWRFLIFSKKTHMIFVYNLLDYHSLDNIIFLSM